MGDGDRESWEEKSIQAHKFCLLFSQVIFYLNSAISVRAS